ncbi:restriction endonuclease subunit S, partial [Sandarakinorhabdus sp. AAP62]|uniref:restriction endonuclease subunit S n=1 Tax=Sandarakinorhabdus sp. AAP62 TaxID=1248916 RepID=UPI00187CC7DC
ILDLAVRGKLVPQDPAEEPATELLRKIGKERAASKHSGVTLKMGRGGERSLSPLEGAPQGWAIVRLADVILGHVGGGTPSKAEPSFWGGDIPWASVKDVGKSKFVSDTQDRITELGLARSSANIVPAGNIILVTRMGLGQLSINTIDLAINQDLRAIFLSKYVKLDYCYNYFLTCEIEGAGMTVKGIKLDDLLGLPFPLPPLAEQQRIVA